MMLGDEVAEDGFTSVDHGHKATRRLGWRLFSPSKKGALFVQSLSAHKHFHVDIWYVNLKAMLYYPTSLLDRNSRAIMHQ